jgi:hypothetical protein
MWLLSVVWATTYCPRSNCSIFHFSLSQCPIQSPSPPLAIAIKSKRSHCLVVPLSHCLIQHSLTAPRPYCDVDFLPHCLTIPLSFVPTALLPHCFTAYGRIQSHCLLSYCPRHPLSTTTRTCVSLPHCFALSHCPHTPPLVVTLPYVSLFCYQTFPTQLPTEPAQLCPRMS